MSECPKCHNEIEEDFGLVTCPNCRAQVMIAIDGEVEELAQESAVGDQSTPLSEALFEAEEPVESERSVETEEWAETKEPNETKVNPNDMSEVAAFANSTASQGRDGLLKFNIFITGVDSAELRTQLSEILADERFLWDPQQILSNMKEGQLKIEDVSAVKSSILVQKLRAMPIELRWEQYAIHQS